jgi:cytochrome c553
MKKALRWAGIGLGSLVGLLLVAVLVLFAMSELALREQHSARAETLAAPTPAQLADAPRQARILGCVACHGEGLRGRLAFEAPNIIRVVAPNVTEIAARASDQQLAAAIRQGIGHDGRTLWVMPSPMDSRLGDAEVTAMIRWIRALPRAQGEPGAVRFGPIGRLAIAVKMFPSAPALMEDFHTQVPIDLGASHAAGRRLAANTCSECHGPALYGQEMPGGVRPPDLRVAAGYDLAQFKTLLRTGATPSGTQLGLMKEVSLSNFSHLTDAEIEALYSYLTARAAQLGT